MCFVSRCIIHLLLQATQSYVQALDTANTDNSTPLSNLIGQAVEEGLDLYLQACAALPEEDYQPLAVLAKETDSSADYLGWLVRQGRLFDHRLSYLKYQYYII